MSKDYLKGLFIFILKSLMVSSFYIIILMIPISITAYNNGWIHKSYENQYVLTDGNKIVVFQGMTHIGLKSFYHEVGQEMTKHRNAGYQIMLEGFGHSGISPLPKTDVNYLTAKTEFEEFKNRYTKIINKDNILNDNSVKYINQQFIITSYLDYNDIYSDIDHKTVSNLLSSNKLTKSASNNERAKSNYLNKAGDHSKPLSTLYKHEKFYIFMRNISTSFFIEFGKEYIEPLIAYFDDSRNLRKVITIEERDKNLANSIINSTSDKIYIIYGSAHFKGVLENLKKLNPDWRVINLSKKVIFDSTI